MSDPVGEILSWFPLLRRDQFEVTSPETSVYNCIAWAAGDDQRWWEPTPMGGFYWPSLLPTGLGMYTLENYLAAFESIGYSRTENSDLEPAIEKVAIYLLPPEGFHAARQLEDGAWVSKLGASYDIRHVDLMCLTGSDYGQVMELLARERAG